MLKFFKLCGIYLERMRGNLGGGEGGIRVGVIVGMNVVKEIWNNWFRSFVHLWLS